MSIQAKKEGLMRVCGMVFILFGVIISIILDVFVLNDGVLFSFILLITISWFFLIIFLKLEKDIFVDNALIISIILVIISTIFIIVGSFISSSESIAVSFIFLSISNVLIITSWHFAISIYKKEKIFFTLGGISYCILTLIFRISSLIAQIGWLLGITPLLLVIVGICLIIIAETIMKKKGLLNYI